MLKILNDHREKMSAHANVCMSKIVYAIKAGACMLTTYANC